MVINATQIRNGMILELEGELYRVTYTMHRTPGKGNACMQTKLKHIINGKNMEKRFLSNERVEKASLTTRAMQYLYDDGDDFVFMDNENFEQVQMPNELIGEQASFLTEGSDYLVTYYEDTPVGIEFPKTMDLKVTLAPPVVKKAAVTNSLKTVELENGMSVQAPGFVKEGDVIRINTETMEYLERAT